MSSSCQVTSENGGHDGVEMAKQEGRRSVKNVDPPVTDSRGGCGLFRLSSDDREALQVVATLISRLSYQVGSNVPDRYSSCPATSENGDNDGVEMAKQECRHSVKNVDPPVTGSSGRGGCGLFELSSNESGGTLVVVATLITTLSYQVGSNVPGGYWQDDAPGHHRAGEPIMRTERLWLYRVFIWSNWVGFAASMGLTLALLTGVPPRCRFVRGLFVLSYSTLILSFTTQQWGRRSLVWVGLLVWVGVVALITSSINHRTHYRLRRLIDWLFREPVQTS